MIEHVRDAVLLLDGSKLEVRGLVAIAPLSAVSRVLLTDVDPQQAAALERAGADVQIVRGDPAQR